MTVMSTFIGPKVPIAYPPTTSFSRNFDAVEQKWRNGYKNVGIENQCFATVVPLRNELSPTSRRMGYQANAMSNITKASPPKVLGQFDSTVRSVVEPRLKTCRCRKMHFGRDTSLVYRAVGA